MLIRITRLFDPDRDGLISHGNGDRFIAVRGRGRIVRRKCARGRQKRDGNEMRPENERASVPHMA